MNDVAMRDAPKGEATESAGDKLLRLEEAKRVRDKMRSSQREARRVDRLELAERYEQELGPEGSEFAIYDSGHLEDPLVVVKRPALVQWTKYEQSKQTPTDRYDFVVPSIAAPSREAFNALREKRIGVEIAASNLMAKMMGLVQEGEAGK